MRVCCVCCVCCVCFCVMRVCCVCCVPLYLYVLRARVRRHVLWCWFCPELLASPGHHQCVYL